MEEKVLSPKSSRCSQRRIEANRRNAKLSTGPKTEAGKRTVSQNAVTHGLTAVTAIVEHYENPHEFDKLVEGLREYYLPVGVMEDQLVEEIAHSLWKKRRARSAEASAFHKATRGEAEELIMKPALEVSPFVKAFTLKIPREKRLEQLKALLDELRELLCNYRQKGVLGERAHYLLSDFRDRDDLIALSKSDPKLFLSTLSQRFRALSESFNIAIPLCEPFVLPDLQMPDPSSLDLLMRYETTITRRMYQAINQLERLQRRRGGENVPAPLAWVSA